MPKITEEEKSWRKYKKFLESLYKESRIYRDLVFLSRIIKMFIYIGTGLSIIGLVIFEKPVTSLENLIYWLSGTIIGKIIALFVGLSLIIYGLEKPRS